MFRKRLFFVICLCVVVSLHVCQQKSQEKIPLPESMESVILSFEVYNHTQGSLTKFEKTLEQGARVTINLRELDVEGVDVYRGNF